jgi:hypothetical protein
MKTGWEDRNPPGPARMYMNPETQQVWLITLDGNWGELLFTVEEWEAEQSIQWWRIPLYIGLGIILSLVIWGVIAAINMTTTQRIEYLIVGCVITWIVIRTRAWWYRYGSRNSNN